MGAKIRLMIVDDSAVIRKIIQRTAEEDPDIEVVAQVANGKEAVEKARELKPDLITMDVEMPVMNGLEALKAIMSASPTRVLMVSSLTTEGADTTLEALSQGAVDFLAKPSGGSPLAVQKIKESLLEKIRAVAASRIVPAGSVLPPAVPQTPPPAPGPVIRPTGKVELILIGTSTGGPNALQMVIPRLPGDLPVGVLIVQHMPPAFTTQLASRLDKMSALRVKEAEEGDPICPGQVLLAPGHSHLVVRRRGQVGLEEEPADLPHRPAVDVMVTSAAAIYGAGALGVIMTGMGQDGKQGLADLKEKGGIIIAQDEKTSVVYGMPRAAVEAGLADQVCPLEKVASAILRQL